MVSEQVRNEYEHKNRKVLGERKVKVQERAGGRGGEVKNKGVPTHKRSIVLYSPLQ